MIIRFTKAAFIHIYNFIVISFIYAFHFLDETGENFCDIELNF